MRLGSYVLTIDKKKLATKSGSSNFSNSFVGAPGQNFLVQSMVLFFLVIPDLVDLLPLMASFGTALSGDVLQSFRTSSSNVSMSHCNLTSLIFSVMEENEVKGFIIWQRP